MAELPAIIGDVYQALCQLEPSESGINVMYMNNIRFLGVDIECRANVDLTEVRRLLLEPFSAHGELRIIQVVGDSGTPINSGKLSYARRLLSKHFTNDTVVEYGFTRSERDANWLVEDVVIQNPALKSLLVGNIVQRTIDSINPPAWSALSQIEHLVFVYRRNGTPTSFGDDTWVSDGVMMAETGDVMICLEGGPQAFSQCVNALLAKLRVIAVTGLREGEATKGFSAAGLLACIAQKGLSDETANAYLTQNPPKMEQDGRIREDLRRLLVFGSGPGVEAGDLLIEVHST